MKGTLRLIGLWAVACLLWVAALGLIFKLAVEYRAYTDLHSKVDDLRGRYAAGEKQYAETLAEGDNLQSNEDFQTRVLKKDYGYTLPDETPIVIIEDSE